MCLPVTNCSLQHVAAKGCPGTTCMSWPERNETETVNRIKIITFNGNRSLSLTLSHPGNSFVFINATCNCNRCKLQVASCRQQAAGCRLPAPGCQSCKLHVPSHMEGQNEMAIGFGQKVEVGQRPNS